MCDDIVKEFLKQQVTLGLINFSYDTMLGFVDIVGDTDIEFDYSGYYSSNNYHPENTGDYITITFEYKYTPLEQTHTMRHEFKKDYIIQFMRMIKLEQLENEAK